MDIQTPTRPVSMTKGLKWVQVLPSASLERIPVEHSNLGLNNFGSQQMLVECLKWEVFGQALALVRFEIA